MERLVSIVAGWSIGYQFALFLILGLAVLATVMVVAYWVGICIRGYPPTQPVQFVSSVGGQQDERPNCQWQAGTYSPSKTNPFLCVFQPEEEGA